MVAYRSPATAGTPGPEKGQAMHSVFYVIGVIVVALAVLSLLGVL
ncbi:MAG: hypothetical protein WD270_01650 [Acetobacterales bacterium]